MVLWSFATMRIPCPNLLEAVSRPLLVTSPPRLAVFPPNMLPTLLWSLTSLIEICGGRTASSRGGSLTGIADDAGSGADPPPSSWAEGVSPEVAFSVGRRGTRGGGRGLVSAGMMPLEVLRMAAAEKGGPLASSLHRMTAQGVVTVAWSYASSGIQPGRMSKWMDDIVGSSMYSW